MSLLNGIKSFMEYNDKINVSMCPLCQKKENKTIFKKVRSSGNFTNYDLNEKLISLDIVLCKNCGFLFRKELWSNKRQKEYFNKEYKQIYKKRILKNQVLINKLKNRKYKENVSYAKLYLGKNNFFKNNYFTEDETRNEITINILIKHIGLSNKSILDVGCGAGGFLKQIKRFKMKKIVGLEPSGEHIANLKKLVKNELSIYHGTLEDFKENSNNKFDIIVLNGVIKHFNDPLENLKYCHSLLTDDGVLYFGNAIEEPSIFVNVKKRLSLVAQNYFTYNTYINLFKLSNFKILYFQKNSHHADFIIKKNNNFKDHNPQITRFHYYKLLIKYILNKNTPNLLFKFSNLLIRIFRRLIKKKTNIRYNSFIVIK